MYGLGVPGFGVLGLGIWVGNQIERIIETEWKEGG